MALRGIQHLDNQGSKNASWHQGTIEDERLSFTAAKVQTKVGYAKLLP